MAERKAVNKYYPPDWDPRKGSVNKRVGQHPLRDRARKLSQGILVIRFELPYNIWCGGCGNHVGMGVRYNAEKSKVGHYYSTPIYKFRMKCHLCDNYFEIQTDPKNHDYVILSGARRKEQRWDPVANEQVVPEDKATQKKLATDAMYKLEHGSDDQKKGKEKVMSLAQIEDSRMSMKDDYILNRMARDKFRAEKKQLKEAADADRAIIEKASLDIELVEETEEDRKLAGLMKYSVTSSYEDKQKEKRKSIEQRPLFGQDTSACTGSSSSSSSSTSNVLPYPRHNPVTLSRCGELKQKLGLALTASYKDPFKSVKRKNGGNLPSPSSSSAAQLGVRLKSPQKPSSLSVKQRNGKRRPDSQLSSSEDLKSGQAMLVTEEEEDLNVKSLVSPSNCDTAARVSVKDCSSVIVSTTNQVKQHVSSSEVCTSAHDIESINSVHESHMSVDSDSHPVQTLSHSDYKVSNTNDLTCLSADIRLCHGNVSHSDIGVASMSGQVGAQDVELSGESAKPSLSSKDSGLQALMCSYTDSDSDSGF